MMRVLADRWSMAIFLLSVCAGMAFQPLGFAEDLSARSGKVRGPHFAAGQDPKPAGQRWVPVVELSDEFEGTQVDDSKWQTDPNAKGWGWIGRPPGLFRPENVSVDGGKLKVVVSPLPEPRKINGNEFEYQGAIVRSKNPGKLGWYFETRMKANATEMSSTFWLITRDAPGGVRQELDIQECVGKMSDRPAKWAKDWDEIFHSNLIFTQKGVEGKVQKQKGIPLSTKNHERFYVYAAWWKSPREVQYFLNGKYMYSLKPDVDWDLPAYIQMAIETYDWNPVPEDGGMVRAGTREQRTTQYDWVRVWRLSDGS